MRKLVGIMLIAVTAILFFGAVYHADAQVDFPADLRAGQVGFVVGAGPDTVVFTNLTATKAGYRQAQSTIGTAIWAKAPFRMRRIGSDYEDAVSFPIDSVSFDNSPKGAATYPCLFTFRTSDVDTIVFWPTASDTLWYLPLH